MSEDAGTGGEVVYFSTKQAEEVGFEKFAKRQAALQGIHVLVLDHLCIGGAIPQDERGVIAEMCKDITQLDVSSNLFESLEDILDLVALLPKLRQLIINGNRLHRLKDPQGRTFGQLTDIHASGTLLNWTELSKLTRSFPGVKTLTAADNELTNLEAAKPTDHLIQLDLSGNKFQTLDDLENLSLCPNLALLILKHNRINSTLRPLSQTLEDIDLAYNEIAHWSFFDNLPTVCPALRHLRVSGNPLFSSLRAANGKQLTAEDSYMLTVARLPQLKTLNYSKITDKERLNAETFYISEIVAELRAAPAQKQVEVTKMHPRWQSLCKEYGEPVISREKRVEDLNPNTLAARLVKFTFVPGVSIPADKGRTWEVEVPKSFNTYALLGLVGKKLSLMPLTLRLMWETGEQDPVAQNDAYEGPEWWDSSEDEGEQQTNASKLLTREVELVAGTRTIGTYIEGGKARVRVELVPDS